MSQDDIAQIRVEGSPVGIIGLKSVMEEMAQKFAHRPAGEVMEELLKRLGKRNYIPDKVRESYGKAFLREFKRFTGEPLEEDEEGGMVIKVLGPGCPQCDGLEQTLMEVMGEMGIMADIEHVRDIKKIGEYGVMGSPGLIINGEVKSVGRVPPKNKLKEWIREAQG